MQTYIPHIMKRSLGKKHIIIIFIISILVSFIFCVQLRNIIPVADVGGSFVSREEFLSLLLEKSGKDIMQRIIVKKFILDEAKRQKITVSEKEQEDQINIIKMKLIKERSTFENYLILQGVNEKQFREEITLQLMVKKLFEKNIIITEKEIDAYLKSQNIVKGKGAIYQSQKIDVTDVLFKQKLQEEFKAFVANRLRDTK